MAKLLAGVTVNTNTKFVTTDGRKWDDPKTANGWQRHVNRRAKLLKTFKALGLTMPSNPNVVSAAALMEMLHHSPERVNTLLAAAK